MLKMRITYEFDTPSGFSKVVERILNPECLFCSDFYSIELHGFGLGPYTPQLIYLAQDISKLSIIIINYNVPYYPFSQSGPSKYRLFIYWQVQ